MTDSVLAWLQRDVKPRVDARLREWVEQFEHSERIIYPIETGGKRIRPGLVYLVSEIAGVPDDQATDVAAGVEMLHNFTLVHDDLIDGDEMRRGEPTMWIEYGEPSAINLGDMMFAKAMLCFPSEVRDLALETVVDVTNGEQMDIDFEDRRDITIEEYMRMVRLKTGALLELCIDAPQVLGEADLGLEGYAALGPMFQIRDDLLDFQEGKGRRNVGNDVRAGKRTLMVVHANDDRLYDILDKPYDETTEDDVERAVAILEEHGSMAFARETMADLSAEVRESLEGIPESPARDRLVELSEFITDREV